MDLALEPVVIPELVVDPVVAEVWLLWCLCVFASALTIGLAIENRELWDQAQATLADLPFRVIVEHQDIGDVSNFLDRLERIGE